MLKVCLIGFGRTGKVVAEEIFNSENVNLVGIFKKREGKPIGFDIGTYFGKDETGYKIHNITDLEKFLQTNPSTIGWYNKVSNETKKHEYVPTKVTNSTLVFSNPSSEYVPVDFEISITSQIAPGTKVRNLAQWIIPVGLIFSLPWIIQIWKRKRIDPLK